MRLSVKATSLSARLVVVLPLLAAAMLAGCTAHKVRFSEHAPYNAPVRYDVPLVMVFPDGLHERTAELKMGTKILPRNFRVYFGEALRREAYARFVGMFSATVMMRESDFERARAMQGPYTPESEPGQEPVVTFDDLVPQHINEDYDGYILRFEAVEFGFEDDRPVIVATVVFEDAFLGVELVRGRLAGRGRAITPSQSDDFVAERIQRETVGACGMALTRLRDRMIMAIESDGSRSSVRKASPE